MYQDYKDLLSAFHAHGVKYLIVGGYAVIFHAQPRATKDIDLLIKPDSANAQAAYDALAEFGAPLENIRPEDFADHNNFFRFGYDPRGVDILTGIPGVDFDAAWERRVEGVIDTGRGLTAFFMSKDDLIASKLASGRARDLLDVEDMRTAEKSLKARQSTAFPIDITEETRSLANEFADANPNSGTTFEDRKEAAYAALAVDSPKSFPPLNAAMESFVESRRASEKTARTLREAAGKSPDLSPGESQAQMQDRMQSHLDHKRQLSK